MSIHEATAVNDRFETLADKPWFRYCEQCKKLFLCILFMLWTYNAVIGEACIIM